VKYVFVNGQLAFEDGKLTGATPGKALRRNASPAQ
jgi:N-acyl-D-aspartate/D-glutamate deacylase